MKLTLWTAILMAICLILPSALIGGVVGTQVINNSEKIEDTDDAVDAIVAAERIECEADKKFRQQYKIRGKAEKKLLKLFVDLAQRQVESGVPPESVDTSRQFIVEFEPLLNRINIIPTPDCEALVEEIEESL